MNYGSLTNEELIRYADTVPAAILAQRLADAIDSEWTEERCNTPYEDGARDGAKESDDAHSGFLAALAEDIEEVLDSLGDDYDVTKGYAQLQAIAKKIGGKL